ncbi:hypothetical protein [Erythrobacter sp. WG]|uniref:hypothetical protein n=1 Tax=Erythrobacter sp. WG TaxID=2985510 RepID=UPI00226E110B|nr:hypothetical protein [Erythrobacter sp. WG]MCX9146597.1 hypothetical protein [Erythrobacter sp. WG]
MKEISVKIGQPCRLADAPDGWVLSGETLCVKHSVRGPGGQVTLSLSLVGVPPYVADDQRDEIVTPVTIVLRG